MTTPTDWIDAAAESYTYPNWPKKTDWDRQERYSSLMYHEIAHVVREAYEAGANAAIEKLQAMGVGEFDIHAMEVASNTHEGRE